MLLSERGNAHRPFDLYGRTLLRIWPSRLLSHPPAEPHGVVVRSTVVEQGLFTGPCARSFRPSRRCISSANPRPRPNPHVPVWHGPDGTFRLALDAAISWRHVLLHPTLGLFAIGGAALLSIFAGAAEFMSRAPMAATACANRDRFQLAEAARRNGEAICALGMRMNFDRRWQDVNARYLKHQTKAAGRNKPAGHSREAGTPALAIGHARPWRLLCDCG